MNPAPETLSRKQPWRFPRELEPLRHLIAVDPNHGKTFEELVNLTGTATIGDPVHLDRARVIAQVRLLIRLYNSLLTTKSGDKPCSKTGC